MQFLSGLCIKVLSASTKPENHNKPNKELHGRVQVDTMIAMRSFGKQVAVPRVDSQFILPLVPPAGDRRGIGLSSASTVEFQDSAWSRPSTSRL